MYCIGCTRPATAMEVVAVGLCKNEHNPNSNGFPEKKTSFPFKTTRTGGTHLDGHGSTPGTLTSESPVSLVPDVSSPSRWKKA